MGDIVSELKQEILEWKPSPVYTSESTLCVESYPFSIERTPFQLMVECERAFDAGLLSAALNLSVTIPDVCAALAGVNYREWCERYLNLDNDGARLEFLRGRLKSQEEVDKGFETITNRGIFTASDLHNLRCAVIHTGSSAINGAGSLYSPYSFIEVCVNYSRDNLVADVGHTSNGVEKLENCAYDCRINLEALILNMARGVSSFIEDYPDCDREYVEKGSILSRSGIVVFQPLTERNAS